MKVIFQPSSRAAAAAAVATSAPPAVPRIGETFQSGLHGRFLVLSEKKSSGSFSLRTIASYPVCLDKDSFLSSKILILALHCVMYNR